MCVFLDTVEASQCVSCHTNCHRKRDERCIDCFYISLLWACLLWGGGGGRRDGLIHPVLLTLDKSRCLCGRNLGVLIA